MKKRIGYAVAGFWLCLVLAGCDADKALILNVGQSENDEYAETKQQTQETAESGEEDAGDAADVIYVHVCGAVQEPQVVALPMGSRGWEAIEAAGGFTAEAAETAVNLAERLADGTQLYIPTLEEAEILAEQERAAESSLVDINRADVAQLCTLPGIGEVRAEAIIEYREANGGFQTPEDIMQVPGIKEGAFAKIQDKITVK